MGYYINEYSLRGQFQSDDEFLKSLLENTLPVLKKIEEEEGIIYKEAMLWDCKVTSKCNLRDFLLTQRKPITTRLKICYQKLLNDPYYNDMEEKFPNEVEYNFDEEYKENFSSENCFLHAWKDEKKVISFEHEEYKDEILPLKILWDENNIELVELNNICHKSWWDKEFKVHKWDFEGYHVEIRAREHNNHAPHFHVTAAECKISFDLKTCLVLDSNIKPLPQGIEKDIREWHAEHKEELEGAWNLLHPPVVYKDK